MTPPVANVAVGDWVRIRRGGCWMVGVVTDLKRSTAHVKVGSEFLGYRTYVEQLNILRSTQPKGGCVQPNIGEIEVANEGNEDHDNQ